MRLLDHTPTTLADNLALDEALLVAAESEEAGEVLRFWEWPTPAVVLGMGGVLADDVDEAACAADGVPLARRSSGGGTVLLGTGCLLYSLVLDTHADPRLADLSLSYTVILGRICDALRPAVPGVEREGTSDLAIGGVKFSGNAQQRKRRFILHHGTLLHALDLSLVPRYLREPPRRPDYRGPRPHAAFVRNLPLSADDLRERLAEAWAASGPPSLPSERVAALVAEKYGRDDWTRRR